MSLLVVCNPPLDFPAAMYRHAQTLTPRLGKLPTSILGPSRATSGDLLRLTGSQLLP